MHCYYLGEAPIRVPQIANRLAASVDSSPSGPHCWHGLRRAPPWNSATAISEPRRTRSPLARGTPSPEEPSWGPQIYDGFFTPYFDLPFFRSFTPAASSAPLTMW